jgi:hypothetical protein
MKKAVNNTNISAFKRKFFNSDEKFTRIGNGDFGGKAQGLYFIKENLDKAFYNKRLPQITVSIPTMTVICTDYFDKFMERNNLYKIAYSELPDERIGHAFQNADLPSELVGDLWALISRVHTPLAIRSSSLLEDAMYEPFAGIYETKMIPNNQFDISTRFHKLIEAIKFVYASTFFKKAKDYIKVTKHNIKDEKMAVIIQEVIGRRYNDRFYPAISGVARSYNYYPIGHANPADGVVNLALGLGKTIVDEGIAWSYSPGSPRANPPFNTISDLMKQTQMQFWAINMGPPPEYNPLKETEYLQKLGLEIAEVDSSLSQCVSTYDSNSDRLYPGLSSKGIKIVTFAPILQLELIPFNELITFLLSVCEKAVGSPVELEFAIDIDRNANNLTRFGFLQIRPMVVSSEEVDVSTEELSSERAVIVSERVLGNGIVNSIEDVVFVKSESFKAEYTQNIALEIEEINNDLVKKGKNYLLIGFGRWGSSDSWLGIPVNWGQINGARVIVEATLPEMNVELSQGSHFFHDICSFQALYFSVPSTGNSKIDWEWLNQRKIISELPYVKHVKLSSPLLVKVDGRKGRGVVLK